MLYLKDHSLPLVIVCQSLLEIRKELCYNVVRMELFFNSPRDSLRLSDMDLWPCFTLKQWETVD